MQILKTTGVIMLGLLAGPVASGPIHFDALGQDPLALVSNADVGSAPFSKPALIPEAAPKIAAACCLYRGLGANPSWRALPELDRSDVFLRRAGRGDDVIDMEFALD